MRPIASLLMLAACGAGPSGDDTDTDTDAIPAGACAWPGSPSLEFGRDVTVGQQPAGHDVDYGRPPQGGAPYTPFQVRLHAEFDLTQRIEVSARAVDVDSDEEIGTASQPQVFLCSNAGPHAGWLYGGEVHVRFWEESLEALAGRTVAVTVAVHVPDIEPVEATTSGELVWTLGLEESGSD